MTRDETKQILGYLQCAYPSAFGGDNLTATVNVWWDAFGDIDFKILKHAVKNFVKWSKYAPTIAGIQEQIDLITSEETNVDLWGRLHKAISNGIYGAKEEFEKLPPECKRFLGTAEVLKELAQSDSATINTVVKGQFMKRIDELQKHENVKSGLPDELKAVIAQSKQAAMIGYEE